MARRAHRIPPIRAHELVDRYECVLLDAYGVLVHASAALPGAAALIRRLRAAGRGLLVVTNDASKLPATSAARYRGFGLDLEADEIITSASLLGPYFREAGLGGARCLVLGPEESQRTVREAGGELVPPDAGERYDAVVVCDDAGYPFLGTLDVALTALFRQFDRGDRPALILPNPDLLFPKGDDAYGFTSGAAAMLLEEALARRYPGDPPRFVRLGKPFAPIFDEARRRAGTDSLVMIGDQLETDIAGARAAGIDAVLLDTGGPGVTRWAHATVEDAPDDPRLPNYVMTSLDEGDPP